MKFPHTAAYRVKFVKVLESQFLVFHNLLQMQIPREKKPFLLDEVHMSTVFHKLWKMPKDQPFNAQLVGFRGNSCLFQSCPWKGFLHLSLQQMQLVVAKIWVLAEMCNNTHSSCQSQIAVCSECLQTSVGVK